MSGAIDLHPIYECPICYELNDTAVSLNPCGHELHLKCALELIESLGMKCPVCRTQFDSYRPSLTTRKAVEIIKKSQSAVPGGDYSDDLLPVMFKNLYQQRESATVTRGDSVVRLIKIASTLFGYQPYEINLVVNNQILDPTKRINEYSNGDQVELTVYVSRNFGGGRNLVPSILEQAKTVVGPEAANVQLNGPMTELKDRVKDQYNQLYESAISERLKSMD